MLPSQHTHPRSQEGLLGYMFQQQFHNALAELRVPNHTVCTVVTQTQVMQSDPAFSNPNKPVGNFYSETEARSMMSRDPGLRMKEDSGRGWRQVSDGRSSFKSSYVTNSKKEASYYIPSL